ncbi:MAG: GNAT family N-acetyltransferase [Acidimicrobiia bacterium]
MNQDHEPSTIEISLRDGTVAEMRPISPEDRGLLAEGLSRMSEQSRFARFGTGVSSLSDSELRYLTEVDQVSHVAWGATIDDEPAGVGRYILAGGSEAEIAITVVDRYQLRGLGRLLFEALAASARAAGVSAFTFSIEPWNRSVLRMLPGVSIELDEADGMLTGGVDLAEIPPGDHDQDFVDLLDRCRQGWPAP